MATIDVGEVTEKLVHNFFNQHFSNVYSFRDPKTSSNAQVADVLVWLNRGAFLIEVKGRGEGTSTIESWARSRLQHATDQIQRNHAKFIAGEQINIHNEYYNFQFINEGINQYVGIVVLVCDEAISELPSKLHPDVYQQKLPIHVFTWAQLEQMIAEIDTTMDFYYYLTDRTAYLKTSDIPLDQEMNALGYYKLNRNQFPDHDLELQSNDYWGTYQIDMQAEIEARDKHNYYSGWIDMIEGLFKDQRKLFDGISIGMYHAWEFGSLDRRVRSYFGERLSKVQEWFDSGRDSRQFCFQNPVSGNWSVFYYSIEDEKTIQARLERLMRLKLIKEIHLRGFDRGIYGIALQVSSVHPRRILGVVGAGIMGVDEDIVGSVPKELEEAFSVWGRDDGIQAISIEEFPQNE